jgi:hypothetical protein
MTNMKCYNCGDKSLASFMGNCPKCGAVVQCCMNCACYYRNAPNECTAGKFKNTKKRRFSVHPFRQILRAGNAIEALIRGTCLNK